MSSAREPGEEQGKSVISREGADICRWSFVGDISAEEMRRLLAIQKSLMEGCDRVLLIIDMSKTGSVSADARKVGAEPSNVKVIGTAIFGASLHIRMIAKLVTTASAVLRKASHEESPVRFFETEKEALAWLDVRRAEVLKAGR